MRGRITAQNHQKNNKELAGEYIMLLTGLALDETPIEIIDEVRRAPVQLRTYRRHESRQERGDHQTAERRRSKITQHHEVALLGSRGEFSVRMQPADWRINGQGNKSRHDPGP